MKRYNALLLAIGLVLGLGLGMWVAAPAPAPLVIPPRLDLRSADASPSEDPPAAAPKTPALDTSESAAPATEPADPLPAAAEVRVKQLTAEFRARAQSLFDSAESRARAQVRQELANERAAQEDIARGGTMAYLKDLAKDFHAPWVTLGSDDVFGKLFQRKSQGREIDGATLAKRFTENPHATPIWQDGDTVRYPAGRFDLPVHRAMRKSVPKDLLFVGAGMDETVLLLDTEIAPRGDVHALTFRDLTLHCRDNYLESMRNGAYTLRLERCRVVGFDMGAGGSSMCSGSIGAVFFSDCRIEARYGRSPGSGNLFDVRGALLVRMVNCDIVGPFRSVHYQWSGAAHVFERCRFTGMTRNALARLRKSANLVQLKDCSFQELSPEEERVLRDAPKRSIMEINPAWRK